MTDREAFEAWLTPRRGKICPPHPEDYWEVWQAALASERAKQSAATNVGIDWANPATLNGVLCHAVQQAEPVAWVREPSLDKRIGHGDDFAGDAWRHPLRDEIVYTAVGGKPSAPPPVQGEPVALHIDHITPDDRKRYYDFEKYADHLPTCKQPRGDQCCECGYSAVRTNLSDLLDELSAPAQQEE